MWRTLVALILAALAACGGEDEQVPYVLVVGLDGVRPDALTAAATPNIDGVMARGAWSLSATTQLDGITESGPGWASVLTGVDASRHGVANSDSFNELSEDTPTFVRIAHDELGLTTGVGSVWAGIVGLIETGTAEIAWLGEDDVAPRVAEWLGAREHRVTFVHFDAPDFSGHDTGFAADNPDYIAAIEATDTRIGMLLDAVAAGPDRSGEDWLIAFTTDHGGFGTEHGDLDADNRTIFVIAEGPGLPVGELDGPVSHMDIAPTVLEFVSELPASEWSMDGMSLY